jgi:hypothetical protein
MEAHGGILIGEEEEREGRKRKAELNSFAFRLFPEEDKHLRL